MTRGTARKLSSLRKKPHLLPSLSRRGRGRFRERPSHCSNLETEEVTAGAKHLPCGLRPGVGHERKCFARFEHDCECDYEYESEQGRGRYTPGILRAPQ